MSEVVDQEEEDETARKLQELESLKAELRRLQVEYETEKAESTKAETSLEEDRQEKVDKDAQILQRTAELNKLQEEVNALVLEGRLQSLAGRQHDFALSKTWHEDPQKGVVLDLAKFSKNLEAARRSFEVMEENQEQEPAAVRKEVQVIHISCTGKELGRLSIPVALKSSYQRILEDSCGFWEIPYENRELENLQGQKFILSDTVSAASSLLILRDIDANYEPDQEASEKAQDQDLTLQELGDTSLANEDAQADMSQPTDESIKSSPDAFSRRDSRMVHHLELLLVIVVVATFVATSLEFRRVPEAFMARSATKRLFAEQASNGSFRFDQVDSEQKMWTWLNDFAVRFQKSEVYLSETCAPSSNGFGVFLSGPLLGQLRSPPNELCVTPQTGAPSDTCYFFFYGSQSPVPFPGFVGTKEQSVADAFRFNANNASAGQACSVWPEMVTDSVPGSLGYYPIRQSDSYSLRMDPAIVHEQLSELRRNNWVDPATRLVSLSFTYFEGSAGAAINVMGNFELLPNGGVVPRWQSTPVFLQVSETSADIFFIVIVLVIVVVPELLSIVGLRRLSFRILLLDALLVVFSSLYVASSFQMTSWVRSCFDQTATSKSSIFDTRGLALQYDMTGNFQGLIAVLLAIKLVQFVDSSPSVSLILRVFSHNHALFISLSVFSLLLLFTMVVAGHFSWGRGFASLHSFDLAFASLWGSFTTDSSAAYVGTNNWGAAILSTLAYMVVFLLVFSMWIAIVASSYFKVSASVRQQGYFWIPGSRCKSKLEVARVHASVEHERYVEQLLEDSGAVTGENALNRRRSFDASNREFAI